MDIDDCIDTIVKLRPQPGDVIVVRASQPLRPDVRVDMYETFAALLISKGIDPTTFLTLIVDPQLHMGHLDLEGMRQHGWVRADEVAGKWQPGREFL